MPWVWGEGGKALRAPVPQRLEGGPLEAPPKANNLKPRPCAKPTPPGGAWRGGQPPGLDMTPHTHTHTQDGGLVTLHAYLRREAATGPFGAVLRTSHAAAGPRPMGPPARPNRHPPPRPRSVPRGPATPSARTTAAQPPPPPPTARAAHRGLTAGPPATAPGPCGAGRTPSPRPRPPPAPPAAPRATPAPPRPTAGAGPTSGPASGPRAAQAAGAARAKGAEGAEGPRRWGRAPGGIGARRCTWGVRCATESRSRRGCGATAVRPGALRWPGNAQRVRGREGDRAGPDPSLASSRAPVPVPVPIQVPYRCW